MRRSTSIIFEEEHHIYLDENIMKHMPNISQYSKGPSLPSLNDFIISEGIRGSLLRAYIKKVIIKSDIIIDVINTLEHFAQRGHQSSTIIKLDSIIEYQLLDFTSISGPDLFSVSSAINIDIMVYHGEAHRGHTSVVYTTTPTSST